MKQRRRSKSEQPKRQRRRKREVEISAADRFPALPDGVLARIVSKLPYWDVIQLYAVCRAWRRLRLHRTAPFVNIDLREFALDDVYLSECFVFGHLVALWRMVSAVDTLSLVYFAGDRRMNEMANGIVKTVDAPKVRITVCYGPGGFLAALVHRLDKWDLYMPLMSTDLQVRGCGHRAPVVYTYLLRELTLFQLEHHDAQDIPSLHSLTLQGVTVAVPFAPGDWCPQLERLRVEACTVEHRQVAIRVPRLKLLVMEDVNVGPRHREELEPFGHVTVDAPALEELVVSCSTGWTVEYESFTLRAPALRRLSWREQFAERVLVDVGMPGAVTEGTIEFKSNGEREEMSCREMKYYRAQLIQMLRGLLPDVPPASIPDVARPSMTVQTSTVEDEDTGETVPEERLTCDLGLLISLRHV